MRFLWGFTLQFVHFAVAIPVIIILLEFFNIFFRRRALSVFSLFLTLLVATVMVGSYYTGVSDGQEAFDMLSQAGKGELKEHKELGIVLVYASLALVILKLFFMLFRGALSRILFLMITLAFASAIFKQGHDGGELVYKFGANNEALQKALDENIDLKDEFEELKSECEEKKSSIKNDEVETKEETVSKKEEEEPQVQVESDNNTSNEDTNKS